mmetsp:Transcript_1458/g.1839  ORF Transcript_1458/g.1839 Transcript_1458/m.1839 type:complete len:430 (-) Transcript_1458:413-1702(-)
MKSHTSIGSNVEMSLDALVSYKNQQKQQQDSQTSHRSQGHSEGHSEGQYGYGLKTSLSQTSIDIYDADIDINDDEEAEASYSYSHRSQNHDDDDDDDGGGSTRIYHQIFKSYYDESLVAPGCSLYKDSVTIQPLLKKTSFMFQRETLSGGSNESDHQIYSRNSSSGLDSEKDENTNNSHPNNSRNNSSNNSRNNSRNNSKNNSRNNSLNRNHSGSFSDSEYDHNSSKNALFSTKGFGSCEEDFKHQSDDSDDDDVGGGEGKGRHIHGHVRNIDQIDMRRTHSHSPTPNSLRGGGGGGRESPASHDSANQLSVKKSLKEMSVLSNLLGVEREVGQDTFSLNLFDDNDSNDDDYTQQPKIKNRMEEGSVSTSQVDGNSGRKESYSKMLDDLGFDDPKPPPSQRAEAKGENDEVKDFLGDDDDLLDLMDSVK